MLSANDPTRSSWVSIPQNHPFPLQNLPLGVFQKGNESPRIASRIGDYIIDIPQLLTAGHLNGVEVSSEALKAVTLNPLFSQGRKVVRDLRQRLADLFDLNHPDRLNSETARDTLIPVDEVEMCMPLEIPNYTDFYSSKEHATNVGTMFRGPENALPKNWLHLPIGYHGRASSIVIDGTPIRRPQGQFLAAAEQPPVFGPSRKLDFELEMAFVIGQGNKLGEPIDVQQAEEHIMGMVLFNDWSARDIQSWEYQPLGPFLGKNFASTISPWVILMDALEPFRVTGPAQDPQPLDYLLQGGESHFNINLEVTLTPEKGEPQTIVQSNHKYLYWSVAQQLAHHTVGGCNMQTGDLCASGTISGPSHGQEGAMLELTWNGQRPITLSNGEERQFLENGDTISLTGYAEKNGIRIGFGEASGKVEGSH